MASERSPLWLVAVLTLAATLAVPASLAEAAEPTAADRETARHLMKLGDEKLAAKDYKAALRSYESAHAIMNVPTTGLAVAKARAGLGELVEARDLLLELVRMPRVEGEPEAFDQARSEAASLAKALEARIPSLVIGVKGPPTDAKVEVTIDGHVVPVVGMSTTRRVNPGAHVVSASSEGFAVASAQAKVKEGETRRVSLKLVPGEGGGDGFEGRGSGVEGFARYREGFHVGASVGPMMMLPLTGGALFGGTAGLVLNVGIAPRVDLRLAAMASMHAGTYPFLYVGGPLSVRVHVSSRFAMSAGLVAGYGNNFEWQQTGFVGGPEWSLLGLKLGDRREIEVDFVQGFRFGMEPVTYHNGFVLTYLFLDDGED